MPETIREYADEKLVESGEYEVLRARHLDFFAGWQNASSLNCTARDRSRGLIV
jgi:predicted ATPase